METISILIADDHEIIHNGIKDILKSHSKYKITGNAFDGEEAIEKALHLQPDIIFMDISMPKITGIEAIKILSKKLPDIKIIALTQHEENEYVVQVLKAGGKGYLFKNAKKDEFINAIETVLKGGRYCCNELTGQMVDAMLLRDSGNEDENNINLTNREIEIIQKIAQDKNNHEIADELNISLRTVETHRRNLMQKLKAKSVVSLLNYAAKKNLIDFKK